MTTMQINAELLKQLSYIADSEDCMKRALDAIKQIVKSRKKSEETFKPRTKEEMKADFETALADVKAYKEGKIEFRSAEDLLDEL